MAKVRKDNKGRNLRPGETQRADGSYMYVYKLGTKKKISLRLRSRKSSCQRKADQQKIRMMHPYSGSHEAYPE